MSLSDVVVAAAGLILGFVIVVVAGWTAAWVRHWQKRHGRDQG